MTPPPTLTAETRRQIGREVMAATQALSRAITDGDVALVKDCLGQGALPEWCHFGKGKKSTTNALGAAMVHRNLDLLELLMDAGADMTVPKNQANPLDMAVAQDFPEAVQLFCKRFGRVPNSYHFIEAIGHPSSTRMFETLDTLSPLDRNADLAGQGTGYAIPPVFLVRTVEMYRLLVDSGADPTLVTQKRSGDPTLDFLEWQLSRDWAAEDSHIPLVRAAIADGIRIDENHILKAMGFARYNHEGYLDFLDLLAEHCPTWSWTKTPEWFPVTRPDAMALLRQREEDRALRARLEGTLHRDNPVRTKPHL